MGSSPAGSFKTLLRALALMVGCLWLLLAAGIVAQSGTETTTTTVTTQSTGNFKHMEVMGRKDKLLVHPGLDLNYMSKRRVPNGPDPIHNRRAGNSRQPPGQS